MAALSIPRVFLTTKEVMTLMGCSTNKAYKIIRELNDETEKKGYMRFNAGKVNKYIFAEKYQIPEAEINKAIEYCSLRS